MAISKLNPIKSTLHLAIDYILNPQKTDNGRLVATYGCSNSNGTQIANEFFDVRNCGTGIGNVLAQHIKQSFKANEVTPEEALQIGIETADKLLGGKYQYVVATHIDTENVHVHIIFNNIDMIDYRSFEYLENRGKVSWKNLRKYSDEVCREHNISVIENPSKNKGKCYYEWQQDSLGTSWKSKLRNAIDETIMQSATFDDFLENIKKRNIDCKYTPENVIKIKFRMEGQERFSRGRTLGWYYDAPQIKRRIEQYQFLLTGISNKGYKTKIIDTNANVFQTSKGLLNWAEIENMKEASRLINFLTNQQIKSESELEQKATSCFNSRMILVSNLNKTQNQINEISDTLQILKTYKKYKPVYDEWKKLKFKGKFEKENANALKKYDDILKKLKAMFPNTKTLPNIEKLENQKNNLINQVQTMNEEYKQVVKELKEIDYARTAINDYMKTVDKNKKQELE